MRMFAIIATVLCASAAANATPAPDTQPEHRAAPARTPPCRFVKDYSQEDILKDPSSFISDYLYWENRFHANNISYNTANGMTYDGTQIDYITGVATEKHPFSAASKEALQLMLFAQALSGSEYAARFVSPDSNPDQIAHIVTDILSRKLNTYLRFNESFPGFGGMLPWFLSNETDIRPTQDFVNRIPALDNGELLWAVYAVVEALHACPWSGTDELAAGWQAWLDYAKTTAATVFYRGNGTVCAVSTLRNQSQQVSAGTAGQNYSCENGGVLDDPYEGELFTFWLYFFGGLSDVEKEALWVAKRPKLVSVEYDMGGVGPITVQEGFWFSSHEPWKLLEMPYMDVDLVRRIHLNGERARTCNSRLTHNPGLFASVNNITNTTTGELESYISAAGIPSIAVEDEDQYLEVVTPYAVWPVVLADHKVGLAWLRNMLLGKKMQNPYGTTEATRIDGTGVSALLTWDSKTIPLVALSNALSTSTSTSSVSNKHGGSGVQDLVRSKMRKDGIYEEFLEVVEREHARVFTEIKGEDVAFCLPGDAVGDGGLVDFLECA